MNIVILNWQRPLWQGDQEAVKRTDRDESVWVEIHMCMEITQGTLLHCWWEISIVIFISI
jgi:hypothetical protein